MIRLLSNCFYAFMLFILCMMQVQSLQKYLTPGPDFIEQNINKTAYSLDSSASATVLYEKVYFRLYQSGRIHKYVKKIVKILTEPGKEFGNVREDGRYSCSVNKVGDQLILVRSFAEHEGVYDKGQYQDYGKFAKAINDDATCNVVLVKN